MGDHLTPEVVDTLVCELGQRPKDAPTIDQITGSVTSVKRDADSLVIDFEPSIAEVVQAVVEAERQCCSTIDWHLETERGLQLRISGKPLQLDAGTVAELFCQLPVVKVMAVCWGEAG